MPIARTNSTIYQIERNACQKWQKSGRKRRMERRGREERHKKTQKRQETIDKIEFFPISVDIFAVYSGQTNISCSLISCPYQFCVSLMRPFYIISYNIYYARYEFHWYWMCAVAAIQQSFNPAKTNTNKMHIHKLIAICVQICACLHMLPF